MPAPLNIDCFRNTEAAFDPSYAFNAAKADDYYAQAAGIKYGNAGMFNPRRIHLSLADGYYRFCDSKRPNPAGGWWTDHATFLRVQSAAQNFQTIKDFAASHGESPLAYSAKLHFAIPYEWGDCGHVVFAFLTARMDAYRGKGNIAFLDNDPSKHDPRDGGAKYIPLQLPELFQLFIPDAHVHFSRAFNVVKQGPASLFM
ncbi:hypothetical protein [Terrarubrum flagellatum]|uniref:hypothetical protein n=1 Tax=Terrirubrum flagellatum TaxID=2895980 RepID=UPI00314548C0